jgi:hypothetical protein
MDSRAPGGQCQWTVELLMVSLMIYISAFCFSEKIAQELQKMIAIDDDESEELDDEFTEESLFNTLTSLSGASHHGFPIVFKICFSLRLGQ